MKKGFSSKNFNKNIKKLDNKCTKIYYRSYH